MHQAVWDALREFVKLTPNETRSYPHEKRQLLVDVRFVEQRPLIGISRGGPTYRLTDLGKRMSADL